jgi:hypothetical protein
MIRPESRKDIEKSSLTLRLRELPAPGRGLFIPWHWWVGTEGQASKDPSGLGQGIPGARQSQQKRQALS